MNQKQALNQATCWLCNRICDPRYHHWQGWLIQHNKTQFWTGSVAGQVKVITKPPEREWGTQRERTQYKQQYKLNFKSSYSK